MAATYAQHTHADRLVLSSPPRLVGEAPSLVLSSRQGNSAAASAGDMSGCPEETTDRPWRYADGILIIADGQCALHECPLTRCGCGRSLHRVAQRQRATTCELCGASLHLCPHGRQWSLFASIEDDTAPLLLTEADRRRIENDMRRETAQTAEAHREEEAGERAKRSAPKTTPPATRLFPPLGYTLPYDFAAAAEWQYAPRRSGYTLRVYREMVGQPSLRPRIAPCFPNPLWYPGSYRDSEERLRAAAIEAVHARHPDGPHPYPLIALSARTEPGHNTLSAYARALLDYDADPEVRAYVTRRRDEQASDLRAAQEAYRAFQVRCERYERGHRQARGRPLAWPRTTPHPGCVFLYDIACALAPRWRRYWRRVPQPAPWGAEDEPDWVELGWEEGEFRAHFPWGIPVDLVPAWREWVTDMHAWLTGGYVTVHEAAVRLGLTDGAVRQRLKRYRDKGAPVPTDGKRPMRIQADALAGREWRHTAAR